VKAAPAAGPAPERWSAVCTPSRVAAPPLLLVAHGSSDPRFAEVVEAVAARVRALAPDVDVRVGYLEHGPPDVAAVSEPDAVAVPLLLSAGYHVRVDLPAQAPGVTVTDAVGPDPRLAAALADRLREAGWAGEAPVTLAAAGSADPRSLADVEQAAAHLADVLQVPVEPAYVSAGSPRLRDLRPVAVASYLLAPGVFADAVTGCGGQVVAAPIGAHPVLAEIVLDRYRSVRDPDRPS
jgi:sirohydrochlorin ferrochelatase